MSTGIHTLLVGVGSPHGDDQAGWEVMRQLKDSTDRQPFELRLAKSPVDLLDWVDGVESMIICDACHGLGQVGQAVRFQWPTSQLSGFVTSGTHNLSLPAVLALAERLGKLPKRVDVWVIEGAQGISGNSISPELTLAIPGLVNRIKNDLPLSQSIRSNECTNSHL